MSPRQATGAALACALAFSVVSPAAPATAAPASTAEVTTERIAGSDRYATAAQVSTRAGFAPTTDVVLARGDVPFDALSAAGLAGALKTGILLTTPGELPAATLAEVDAYGAPSRVRVHVLGGTSAVSPEVRAQLGARGHTGPDPL